MGVVGRREEGTHVQVGEQWAHYASDYGRTPPSQVEIVAVVPRPKRDRYVIRFDDGREREVAASRLKCRWEDVAEHQAIVAAEQLMRAQRVGSSTLVAMRMAFRLVPPSAATVDGQGEVMIHEPSEVERLTGCNLDDLLAGCGVMAHESGQRVSAVGGSHIAAAVCAANPAAVLATAYAAEPLPASHGWSGWGPYGRTYGWSGDEDGFHGSPQDRYVWYAEAERPALELIRRWCGVAVASRHELAESLEAEAHRLWLLAHRMVNALARHDPQAALGFRESLVDGQISTDHVRIATPRLPSITGDTVGAWES
jgi:hypothetical protein